MEANSAGGTESVHTVFGPRTVETEKKPFKPPPPPPTHTGPLPNSLKSRLADGRAKKEYAVKGKKVAPDKPWGRHGRPKGAKNLTRPESVKFELSQYTPQAYRVVVNMFKEGLLYDEVLQRTNLHPYAIENIMTDYERISKKFNDASSAHTEKHAKRCVECRSCVADFCRACAETVAVEPEIIETRREEVEIIDPRNK